MESEVTCVVCSEVYSGGELEPVALPTCGHTFCRGCLRGLVMTAGPGGVVCCPTCRAPHQGPPPHTLPPVFALLSLARHHIKTQRGNGAGCCGRHGAEREFWCHACCEALCGHCLLEGHVRSGHPVQTAHQVVAETQKELKQRGRRLLGEVKQHQEAITTNLAHLLARLVRAAQSSQAFGTVAARTTALLSQAQGVTMLEAALLTSTLMESLEAEVDSMESRTGKENTKSVRARCTSCSQASDLAQSQTWLDLTLEASAQPQEVTDTTKQDCQWDEAEASDAMKRAFIHRTNSQLLEETSVLPEPGKDDGSTDMKKEEESQDECEQQGVWCWVEDGQGRRGELRWEGGCLQMSALTLPSQHTYSHPHTHHTHTHGLHSHAYPDDVHPMLQPPTHDPQLSQEQSSNTDPLNPEAPVSPGPVQHNQRDIIIQLPLLEALTHRASPVVYLDLYNKDRRLGRVYIRLWGHLRRAQHFLALCTGTRGPSYRGGVFHGVAKRGVEGETLAGGRYLTEGGSTSVKGLMEGLEWGGRHVREKRKGLVVGASGGRPDFDAYFHICTRGDPKGRFGCAFGEVVERPEGVDEEGRKEGSKEEGGEEGEGGGEGGDSTGMDVVQAAVTHLLSSSSAYIADCGVTLPPPSKSN